MRILYLSWGEIIASDVADNLKKLGCSVDVINREVKSYIKDTELLLAVENMIDSANTSGEGYDCIFSCNFMPILSKVALRKEIVYVSWTYDSPCMTMYSQMIYNPYNRIFHFDRYEVERLRGLGVKNVYHLPLGVDVGRVAECLKKAYGHVDERFVNSGVSFMGNLYNNEVSLTQAFPDMPVYEKGFIEGMISSQLVFPGCDLIEEITDDSYMQRIGKYISFTSEDEFFVKPRDLVLNMLEKTISSRERIGLLEGLAARVPVTLYSQSDASALAVKGVRVDGYIDYTDEMPVMFANSAINLNVTIRSIRTGIPLRALDIMASGGFLLTNPCQELQEFMMDGEDYVTYYSVEDCIQKAVYYLEHEEERRAIAANGHKKVSQMFSYESQLRKMINFIQNI